MCLFFIYGFRYQKQSRQTIKQLEKNIYSPFARFIFSPVYVVAPFLASTLLVFSAHYTQLRPSPLVRQQAVQDVWSAHNCYFLLLLAFYWFFFLCFLNLTYFLCFTMGYSWAAVPLSLPWYGPSPSVVSRIEAIEKELPGPGSPDKA